MMLSYTTLSVSERHAVSAGCVSVRSPDSAFLAGITPWNNQID
jgi:hypothetical protein